MKYPKKKAFSLIELIIVIAVISAITAIIVPSITNLSSQGKNASDMRNIQVWNNTFQYLKSLESDVSDWEISPVFTQPFDINKTEAVKGMQIEEIKGSYMLAGQEVSFSAPSFTLLGTLEIIFDVDKGLDLKSD